MNLESTFEAQGTATLDPENNDRLEEFLRYNIGLIKTEINPLEFFDNIKLAKPEFDAPWNLYLFIGGFNNREATVNYFSKIDDLISEVERLNQRIHGSLNVPIIITNVFTGEFYTGKLNKPHVPHDSSYHLDRKESKYEPEKKDAA